MIFQSEKLQEINKQLDQILLKVLRFEKDYYSLIENVHPNYRLSAKNLVHFLALRTFNSDRLQHKLASAGITGTADSVGHILYSLISLKTVFNSLLGVSEIDFKGSILTPEEAKELHLKNTNAVLGKPLEKRRTRIMVTQPNTASEDVRFVIDLLKGGMNCARINCAHDNNIIWKDIIDNIKSYSSNCKIMMDLAGPKLRTGKMKPGPKVIHVKPFRNVLGQVIKPAKIWLAPYGILPLDVNKADAIIPVNKKWLQKTKKGSYIVFLDAREKKSRFFIDKIEGLGRWANCSTSAYLTSDTLLNVFLEKKSKSEIHTVHQLLPLEEIIYLLPDDLLRIDMTPILGEPAKKNDAGEITEMAHISCSLPQVFDFIKSGESIFFDDGKIEGRIEEKNAGHFIVRILNTKKKGGKLKAEKGINFPESKIKINGLTDKDKTDLKFIAQYADCVNFSFVNNKDDVADLLAEMKRLNTDLGIILKVETLNAFKNLPSIILKAMENYPIGVMIARGDLAIETGWKHFAVIQEEIIRICEAAHIPVIWATQVLENLAKKGVPTRSEITDAAMAQRTECVMLNKGYFINRAIRMLDKVLYEMQNVQAKKKQLLPKLDFNPLE